MNKILIRTFLMLICIMCLLPSCDDQLTYGEKRERERKQIDAFIKNGCQIASENSVVGLITVDPIKVITEEQFYAQDSLTDISKNEYVLFAGSGLYMQIVRKGVGEKIKTGERATVLARYIEFNIATDSLATLNTIPAFASSEHLDVMTVANNYGTLTASFRQGRMLTAYKSATVPSGWLTPLKFINIGRQDADEAEIALVRIIVPSTEGQVFAAQYTIPFFYEISFQRGR